MVLFDLLKISDDGKRMYMDFHVNGADYFANQTLKTLTIMTADQVSETDPLTPTANYVYKLDFEDGIKTYSTVLQPTDFNERFLKSNFSSDLFYVYVEVQGTPAPDTPCRLDEPITLNVTFDENILHQKVLGYTNELANTCQVPQGFINFILMWEALKSSIESQHAFMVYKYWKLLFEDGGVNTIGAKNCGCHGKNSL